MPLRLFIALTLGLPLRDYPVLQLRFFSILFIKKLTSQFY